MQAYNSNSNIKHKDYVCVKYVFMPLKRTIVQFILASGTIVLSNSPSMTKKKKNTKNKNIQTECPFQNNDFKIVFFQ